MKRITISVVLVLVAAGTASAEGKRCAAESGAVRAAARVTSGEKHFVIPRAVHHAAHARRDVLVAERWFAAAQVHLVGLEGVVERVRASVARVCGAGEGVACAAKRAHLERVELLLADAQSQVAQGPAYIAAVEAASAVAQAELDAVYAQFSADVAVLGDAVAALRACKAR